jgi:hypothetical protein
VSQKPRAVQAEIKIPVSSVATSPLRGMFALIISSKFLSQGYSDASRAAFRWAIAIHFFLSTTTTAAILCSVEEPRNGPLAKA